MAESPRLLLWCVGFEVAAKELRELTELTHFGKHGVNLPDLAEAIFNRYCEKSTAKDVAEAIPIEMEQLAQAETADIEQIAASIAMELMPSQSASVRDTLAGLLGMIPAQIRKAFKRKKDPTGKSRPAAFLAHNPEDILLILPPRPPKFKVGDPLPNDPKWILIQRLDWGGFGEVWKVRHATLRNRYGAVKFCLAAAAQERLLKHEARVIDQVMQIKNDNIVRLEEIDFNTDAPWLRYEFVDGGTLNSAAKMPESTSRRASWSRTIMLPLARAVGACHLLNPPVVHRDLKPANVLVDIVAGPDGKKRARLKITDFGISEIIAQQALDQAETETRDHISMATPTIVRGSYTEMYASPQQKDRQPAAPTDDVYALGVIWFQLLMGDYYIRLGRDYREDLTDLSLCEELIAVLSRCVADKAERRWQTAKALADAIENLPNNLMADADDASSEKEPMAGSGTYFSEPSPPQTPPPDVLALPAAVSLQPLPGQTRLEPDSAPDGEKKPEVLVCAGGDFLSASRVKAVQKNWAAWLGVPVIQRVSLSSSVALDLVLIPPGRFLMGSPTTEVDRNDDETLHEVELTRPFLLAMGPTTQEQYIQIMQVANPAWFASQGKGSATVEGLVTKNFPVEQVNHLDALEFCRRLAICASGKFTKGRLPTEAEWEYACRAGVRMPFHFGLSLYGVEANCDGSDPYGTNTKGPNLKRTCNVGKFEANAFGLYDMHGNVSEWCMDVYGPYQASKREDPVATTGSNYRVIRGGSWRAKAKRCRAAARDWDGPSNCGRYLGFRAALFLTDDPHTVKAAPASEALTP